MRTHVSACKESEPTERVMDERDEILSLRQKMADFQSHLYAMIRCDLHNHLYLYLYLYSLFNFEPSNAMQQCTI